MGILEEEEEHVRRHTEQEEIKKEIEERRREDVNARQGRSHKTRQRVMREKIAKEKKQFYSKKKDNSTTSFTQCVKCESDLVVDHLERGGAVYCASCGFETPKLVIIDQPEIKKKYVKQPYQPIVHFRQVVMSAMGKDPRVPLEHVEKIESWLLNNPEVMGNCPFYVGSESIKRAVSELKLNRAYSSRWVQIRSRFTVEGIRDDVACIDKDTLYRLGLRFNCVVKAFNSVIKCGKGKAAKKAGVHRRNIMTLNYVIPQLMRLESEELFRDNARFFPILTSDTQPKLDNVRWKLIIDHCNANSRLVYCKKEERVLKLEWEYKQIRTEDLFNYFFIYR